MKKVYICCNMPHGKTYIGGVAAIVNSYIGNEKQFADNGYSVQLFDFQHALIDKIPLTPLRTFIYGLGQRAQISEKCKTGEENIVHIHTSRSFLYLKDIWLARSICKARIASPVLTIHVGHIATVHKYLPKALQRLAIRWINRYVSRVVFLSNTMMQQFISAGLNANLCEVLYNFHDIGETDDLHKSKTIQGLRLLFAGMINRDKGILDLLDALKLCKKPDVSLDICGTITDESIREEYQSKVQELGKRVNEWGYVKGQRKLELFSSADVLILPSYHEGLPLVVMEALAVGCAMILTPVGSIPEVLSDENTIWVKPGDVEGIANAIESLSNSNEIVTEMQEKNKKLGQQYSMQAHIQHLCGIYDSVTNMNS